MKNKLNDVVEYMSPNLQNIFKNLNIDTSNKIEEIRLRVEKPLLIHTNSRVYGINTQKGLISNILDSYICQHNDISQTFQNICENSIYSYLEEIKQGFVSLKGGHRVGFCGRAVSRSEIIENIKDISSINFRVAREIIGAACGVMDRILSGTGVVSTLIISPPGCGKTTILRDIARQLSNKGFKVAIADERSEIAACYKGVPQNDVGIQTDVLDGCTKDKAMIILLRSMNPDVIITDEIAGISDCNAVFNMANSGVAVIASAHASDYKEIVHRSDISRLIEAKLFKNIISLSTIHGEMEYLSC